MRKKNPWIALGLSSLLPGLGQLYSEKPLKAALFITLPYFLILLWSAFSLVNSIGVKIPGLVAFGIIIVAFVVWNLTDAYRAAGRNFRRDTSPIYSRWQGIILILIAESILGSFLNPLKYVRENYFEPYVMLTNSMAPTLIEGDRFYVDKKHFRYGATPTRGELVAFLDPDTKITRVNRLVGLPGDRIEIRDGVLFVNETEAKQIPSSNRRGMENVDLMESSRVYSENLFGKEHLFMLNRNFDGSPVRSFSQVTVPEGHFFVLGDYRDSSYDSREFGFVPLNHLLGIPIQIWFSHNSRQGKSHFSRIGMDLQ